MGSKTRALAATAILAGVFTVFSWRLIDLQVASHKRYGAIAARKNVDRKPIFAHRGVIYSSNGELLAINEPVKHVIADGSLMKDSKAVAAALAPLLEMPKAELIEKLERTIVSEGTGERIPSRYIVLKKEVPEIVAMKIAAAMSEVKERCITFEQDFHRYYPNGTMLGHVLGYVNSESTGVAGIEQSMNDRLRGVNGYRYFEHDRSGGELVLYRGQERAPKHGKSIRLTIDAGIQRIVEEELNEAMKDFRPKFAVAIIQRPRTGEILAMATAPGFDPNAVPVIEKGKEKDTPTFTNPLINRAIAASFEPGSTFKIVAAGGALTEGLVNANTHIFCENGYYRPYKLKDHHGYGSLSVPMILVKSSNIGACKLALQLGEQRFYEYIRKFGFGEKTGIVLPGEEVGLLRPPTSWTKLYSISRIPMGHEISVTPIQSITSMSVIANGGNLMVPQIVGEIIDDETGAAEKVPPQVVRTVLSKASVEVVRAALAEVVGKTGTARLAAVKGFSVAGKTGTAQVYENGKVTSNAHRVSFVGFLPADKPEFTALVMVEQPKTAPGQDMGGLVAAPIFAGIAERTAQYLGLQPDILPGEPVTQSERPNGR